LTSDPIPPALPRRSLTLRDVSEASGVSEMTVSRVLRNRADVSPATRARVMEAARRLGYVPNRIAGALASARVNLVAVVIPSLSNMVFPEVLAGIAEGLDGSGLQPVVGATGYDPAREEAVLYEMLSWRPSGVIVAGLEHAPAARAMLAAAGVPVVEIMDVDGPAVDSVVGISHRRAGRATGEAILAAGYRRIGVLGTAMAGDHRARKRMEGFEAALAAAGIAPAAVARYEGGSSLLKGRELAQALLAERPDLDFLHCTNDLIGAGALLWCLEAGWQVPDRIGLSGFNGIELLDGLPVRLATMDAGRRETGRVAAGILREGRHGIRRELTPRLERGGTIR
jgi:LacI family gluconate utilization system Gnt-I transcriptional repressor